MKKYLSKTTIARVAIGLGVITPVTPAWAAPTGAGVLVVKRGPNAGSRFPLDRPVTTVGRHASSDIVLDDVTVSCRHAEFRWDSGEIRIVDLGSLYGTYVNWKPVDSVVLANGDEIQIGRFRLVFLSSPQPVDTEDPTQTVLPRRVPRIAHKSDNQLCQRKIKL